MSTKVAIVNVKEYETVPEAVKSAIKLLKNDLGFEISRSEKILLKPNLLASKKDACTQPAIVEGVISYLKEIGIPMSNVSLGDSPGQSEKIGSDVAKAIGVYDLSEIHGFNFVDFEGDIPIVEKIDGASNLKEIRIAKAVKECDVLINLPRLKSHLEATMTGAIKNYWGIIPGGLKAKYHLFGKSTEQFGAVLADNFSWIVKNKPKRFTVYDLQRIMEGSTGPGGGKMVTWDLILVGTDEVALDSVAMEIGKIKPNSVPHLKNAVDRDLGIGDLGDIEIIGMPLEDAKKQAPKFKVPGSTFTSFIAYMSGHIGYKIIKKIPKLTKSKCIKCGECAQNCAAQAIKFEVGEYPIFLRNKCISCFCCAELCSEVAIEAKSRGLAGLFD